MAETNWQELAYTLFEEAGDALFLFDPETEEIQDVNPMAQRLSGYSRRELLQMKVTYIFRSETKGGVNRLRQAFRRTGLFHSQEGFLLRHQKEGAWIPVNLTITRLHAEPSTLGLITARDITERKRADEALRESESRQRLLIEQLPAILWTTDADLRITSSQGAGLAALQMKPNQTNGMLLSKVLDNDDPRFLPLAAHRRALRGEAVSYEMVWHDRPYQVHIEPLVGTEGSATGCIGIALDVTERLKAEEALRSSEAKYRSLVENLTQCVFLKDEEFCYVAVNKPFCQYMGKNENDILGRTDDELFPDQPIEKYRIEDQLVLSEGRHLEVEVPIVVNGKTRTLLVVKSPLQDDRGRIIGVLGIFWDVTEQRTLEAQLRQAQKMDAIGQLAGGIAHDFNNLLTAILGNLELAHAELPESHPCRELLSNAVKAGFRAAEMTRQLLSFARQTPLRPGLLSLNTCIDETLRLLRRTIDPRIALQVKLEANLWGVQADAAQMGQVLMNLCLNARDAMPEGGTLSFETANVTLGDDDRETHLEGRPGEFACLSVQDNGRGMPAEVLAHLFEPFFTTKGPGKGTGLGLAMVFGIVKQHEGWIECHSVPGQGTCFRVYLPRISGAGPPAAAPVLLSVKGGSETILLADDHEMVRRVGKDILERQGYKVLPVANGIEALQIYRERAREIDLVILDLAMPRMSGQETLRELRLLNPAVRALVASGNYTDQAIQAVEREGAAGFVAKPYRPVDLAQSVRAALDRNKSREMEEAKANIPKIRRGSS